VAKKIKSPLTDNRFGAKLYVCLCMDAMIKMMKGDDEETNAKIVDLLEPLVEELYEDNEILA
jgi:hypothetical protein